MNLSLAGQSPGRFVDRRRIMFEVIAFVALTMLTIPSATECYDFDRVLVTTWPNWLTMMHPVALASTALVAWVVCRIDQHLNIGHFVAALAMATAQAIAISGHCPPTETAVSAIEVALVFIATSALSTRHRA